MWQPDVTKRNVGVRWSEGLATGSVWAPLVKSVDLIKGNERIALQIKEIGFWQVRTNRLQPGDLYKFSLDKGESLPDPASLYQPEGVHGPSQVVDLNFDWTDADWQNYDLEDYIIYELHTGTFTEEGNFAGIEKKLTYLKELGITAIEIMPVAQFSGYRNWGYDGVYPFAVQNNYGGAIALQHLVNSCHLQGLAVILDVVYNHLGPEGNYLSKYGPFFTEKYQTPWGPAINFDDAWCDGVRHFFIENALMWFRDFHVDALRLDAAHAIKDFSATHFLQELRQRVDALSQHTGRRHWLIAECDLNDPKYIEPLSQNGYGMHAQWIDEFHHALRVTAGEPPRGYYEDFNGLLHLAKSFSEAYVYDGMFSPHRNKCFGKATKGGGQQFIVFSQNHDQVGNRPLGERSSVLYSFEMQKTLAAAVLFSPFLPLLFMGEEWAETNPFQYFVNHEDVTLCEAVRQGRKAEFDYFFRHSKAEPPDPVSEKTFQQSKLQWHLKESGKHKVMLQYYKELIRLRREHPLLRKPDRNTIDVWTKKDQELLFLKRQTAKGTLLAIFNFSKFVQQLSLDTTFQPIFFSAAEKWMGPESQNGILGPDSTLPAESVILLPAVNASIHV